MIFQQVPQLLQIFFLQHFGCLVLQEAGSRLLSHSKEQRIITLWLFEEELRNLFEGGVLRLFKLFFYL